MPRATLDQIARVLGPSPRRTTRDEVVEVLAQPEQVAARDAAAAEELRRVGAAPPQTPPPPTLRTLLTPRTVPPVESTVPVASPFAHKGLPDLTREETLPAVAASQHQADLDLPTPPGQRPRVSPLEERVILGGRVDDTTVLPPAPPYRAPVGPPPVPPAPPSPVEQGAALGRQLADAVGVTLAPFSGGATLPWTPWHRDRNIAAAKALLTIPEMAVGAADIVSQGRAGPLVDRLLPLGEVRASLDAAQSPALHAAHRAISDAEGVRATLAQALLNPEVIADTVLESLPGMYLGARGGGFVFGPAAGAAVGEGVVSATQAATAMRAEAPDRRLPPGQAGVAALIGAGTGMLGAIGRRVARTLGFVDVDEMLAGATANPTIRRHAANQIALGAIQEGLFEELPQSVWEQWVQNVATGRPPNEGLDEAAVLGLLAGAVMGGGAQAGHLATARRPSAPPMSPAQAAVRASQQARAASRFAEYAQRDQAEALRQPPQPPPPPVGPAIHRALDESRQARAMSRFDEYAAEDPAERLRRETPPRRLTPSRPKGVPMPKGTWQEQLAALGQQLGVRLEPSTSSPAQADLRPAPTVEPEVSRAPEVRQVAESRQPEHQGTEAGGLPAETSRGHRPVEAAGVPQAPEEPVSPDVDALRGPRPEPPLDRRMADFEDEKRRIAQLEAIKEPTREQALELQRARQIHRETQAAIMRAAGVPDDAIRSGAVSEVAKAPVSPSEAASEVAKAPVSPGEAASEVAKENVPQAQTATEDTPPEPAPPPTPRQGPPPAQPTGTEALPEIPGMTPEQWQQAKEWHKRGRLVWAMLTRDGKADTWTPKVGDPTLTLPEAPGVTFSVYRNPDEKRWFVIENTTGMSVGAGPTKQAAIETAREQLRKFLQDDPTKLTKVVAKAVAKQREHGLPPRPVLPKPRTQRGAEKDHAPASQPIPAGPVPATSESPLAEGPPDVGQSPRPTPPPGSAGPTSDRGGRPGSPRTGSGRPGPPASGRTGDARPAEPTIQTEDRPAEPSPVPRRQLPDGVTDYVITDDRQTEQSGLQKLRDNIAALTLLRQLQAANRATATPDEQAILAKWSGWGHQDIKRIAFQLEVGRLTDEQKEARRALAALLTDDEREAAAKSTLNAHYTHPAIARAINRVLHTVLGFSGGRMLEPAVGSGVFLATLPRPVYTQSTIHAIELEPITAAIARYLYPSATVETKGFEKARLPHNAFDVIWSNVPFGNYPVFDPSFETDQTKAPFTKSIHNYFFAKALDLVRPGGLIAFITSRYTMDSQSGHATALRTYLANQANLLAAVRLPGGTFADNAGTMVTSDLIILQKRGPHDADTNPDWINTTSKQFRVQGTYRTIRARLNTYWDAHPAHVLGEPVVQQHGMYGEAEYAVAMPTPDSTAADIAEALEQVLTKALEPHRYRPADPRRDTTKAQPISPVMAGHGRVAILPDGTPALVSADPEAPPEVLSVTPTQRAVLTHYVAVREALRRALDTQIQTADEDAVAQAQQALTHAYDAFVKAHGHIRSPKNWSLLAVDPDAVVVRSLEIVERTTNPQTGKLTTTIRKADIFTKRTLAPFLQTATAATPQDALSVSLAQHGRVDLPFMATMLGQSEAQVAEALDGWAIFRTPDGTWEPADVYLSGDVVTKLEEARAANLSKNITALEAVQPKRLRGGDEIVARLGAQWIPTTLYSQFVAEMLGEPDLASGLSVERVANDAVTLYVVRASDRVAWEARTHNKWRVLSTTIVDMLEALLNSRTITIKTEDGDVDYGNTERIRELSTELAKTFEKWVWQDPTRAAELEDRYNQRENRLVVWTPDGSHLKRLPGMAIINPAKPPDEQLHPHQKNAIWRGIIGGNMLLAHRVGKGKTYTGIAIGMERRRLGTARKLLYVVPKVTREQWVTAFARMYPQARVLAPDQTDFTPAQRPSYIAKVATGDWDAVILTHEQFKQIPISDQAFRDFINASIRDLHATVAQLGDANANQRTITQLLKRIERLDVKLRTREAKLASRADRTLEFEALGVDFLFVDEAHAFKNLFFHTALSNIKGLSQSDSDRAIDMFLKVQHVSKRTNHRGVVFATGTPVSNSLAELYHMQRYLQLHTLQQRGVAHFDAWRQTFADVETLVERTAAGTYVPTIWLSRFVNLPELLGMYRLVADVSMNEDPSLPVVKMKGGKPIIHALPASRSLKMFMEDLVKRIDDIKAKRVDPSEDNMLRIFTHARWASINPQLVYPQWPEPDPSRLHEVATTVADIYHRETHRRGTQLIFLDVGVPKRSKEEATNLYAALRRLLIARGVSPADIAFMHDYDTPAKREQVMAAVNEGQIRILLSSTGKGGVGVNVQRRLVALHEVDVPANMRPADVEQREGRILRQGNLFFEQDPTFTVEIHRYLTEDSFDQVLWQRIAKKQHIVMQALSGDLSQRVVHDVDPAYLSYEEAAAIATGDPRVLQFYELSRRLDTLRAQREAFLNSVAQAKRTLALHDATTQAIQAELQELRAYHARTPPVDPFTIIVEGRTYTTPEEARQALKTVAARLEQVTAPTPDAVPHQGTVGHFGGVPIQVSARSKFIGQEERYYPALMYFGMDIGTYQDPLSYIRRYQKQHPAIAVLEQRLQREQEQFVTAKRLVESQPTFAHEAEYQFLTSKVDTLARELGIVEGTHDVAIPASATRATDVSLEDREEDTDDTEDTEDTDDTEDTEDTEPGTNTRGTPRRRVPPSSVKGASGRGDAARGTAVAGAGTTRVFTQSVVGRPTPAPVSLFSGATDLQPMSVPALVELATVLGGVPDIVTRFRASALGQTQGRRIALRADLFRVENLTQLAAALAHEIGHVVDFVPDETLKRGNLLGRLYSLRKYMAATFSTPFGTVANKDIRKELVALSALWRPWDPEQATKAEKAYRASGKELYADALSVLLNAPNLLAEQAPLFFKRFFEGLDRKPEVRDAYADLQRLLHSGPAAEADHLRSGVREMFGEATDKWRALEAERRERARARRRPTIEHAIQQYHEKHYPLIWRVKQAIRQGHTIAEADNPIYAMEERAYMDGLIKAYLELQVQPIRTRLQQHGMSWDREFAEVVFYERILGGDTSALTAEDYTDVLRDLVTARANKRPPPVQVGDRADLANPRGITIPYAQWLHATMRQELGEHKWAVLQDALERFRDYNALVADYAYDRGLLTDDQYKLVQQNRTYATWRVTEYLDKAQTARIYQQIGTLKDIGNPATATVEKNIVTLIAAEHNYAKTVALTFLKRYAPSEVSPAETRWTGHRHEPVEPRDPDLELVTVLEAGRLVGYYLPVPLARSLNNYVTGHDSWLVRFLAPLNAAWFRPIFTSLNLGFQAVNFLFRDFLRAWKTPGMTLPKLVRRYVQAHPIAKTRAFGLPPTPTVGEEQAHRIVVQAEQARIFARTFSDLVYSEDVELTQLETLLARSGIIPPVAQQEQRLQRLRDGIEFIRRLGDYAETMPKAAMILEYMDRAGVKIVTQLSPAQRSFIRRKVGSPDFLAGGTWKPLTNNLLLFSSAITHAWVADMEMATDPQTRAQWWAKTAIYNLAPKVLMFMAVMGAFDDDEDDETNWLRDLGRMLRKVSEHVLTNYHVIPLGEVNGRPVVLTLPQDDTGRLLSALLWKTMRTAAGDREFWRSVMDVFSYMGGQIPSPQPLLEAAVSLATYLSGGVPRDRWRNRDVLTTEDQLVRDSTAHMKVAKHLLDTLGFSALTGILPTDRVSRPWGIEDYLTQAPVIGRFVRLGDTQPREEYRQVRLRVARTEAARNRHERTAARARVEAWRDAGVTPSEGDLWRAAREIVTASMADAPAESRTKRVPVVVKKLRMTLARGKDEALTDEVLNATSTEQVRMILAEAKRTMPAAEWTAWVRDARKAGVISFEVAASVRRKEP